MRNHHQAKFPTGVQSPWDFRESGRAGPFNSVHVATAVDDNMES